MTIPQQNQAAPAAPPHAGESSGTGYASPMPVVRAHLGHAVASEWTKIRSVRSTLWTLGLMVLLVVGIGSLVAYALGGQEYAGLPVLSGGFFGLMFGQLCVVALGVLVITSEYGSGMIRPTLTACPQRARVLTAKAVVLFLLAFAVTLLACVLTSLVQVAVLEGKPLSPHTAPGTFNEESMTAARAVASGGEWLDATVGAALYVALLGLLSMAVGAVLRSTPGAITVMIGVVLLPFVASLFLLTDGVREFGRTLREYSVLNGLSSLYRLPIEGGAGDTGGRLLLGLLAVVTLVALAGAYARISTRDV